MTRISLNSSPSSPAVQAWDGMMSWQISCQLDLHYFVVPLSVRPNATVVQNKKIVVNGSKVVFNCSAAGDLPVNISWSKTGSILNPVIQQLRMSDRQSQLIISEAEIADTGTYECEVSNGRIVIPELQSAQAAGTLERVISKSSFTYRDQADRGVSSRKAGGIARCK